MTAPRRASLWLGRLAALGFGLVGALALGELGARLLVRTYVPIAFDVYYKDARGQLRLQPQVVRRHASPEWNVHIETNAAGFRDVEAPPGPDQRVVLVLGDSMAFGWGVEYTEAFPARLGVALARENVRVENAAVPGTGTTDRLSPLRELLPQRRAKAVVVAFFVGNDFDDVASGGAAQYDIRDGLLAFKGQTAGGFWGASAWLKRRSHLAQLVAERLWLLEMRRAEGVPVERREHPGLARRDAFLRRYVQIHLREPLPSRLERGVADTLLALEELERLTVEHGARLILAVVPRSIQVYDVDRRRYEQAFGLGPGDWDLDRPQRILHDWAGRRKDVVFVDLLPPLRNAAASGPEPPRLYYFPDSHLAAAGHAVVAAELSRILATAAGMPIPESR